MTAWNWGKASNVLIVVLLIAAIGSTILGHGRSPTSSGANPTAQATDGARLERESGLRLNYISAQVAEAKTVLVLGDSVSYGRGSWVGQWARDLRTVRSISEHLWRAQAEVFSPRRDIGGAGSRLSIWNLSKPGADAAYSQKFFYAITQRPDVIVYSFSDSLDGEKLLSTMKFVKARWGSIPTAWVLPNPSTTEPAPRAAAIDRLRILAQDNQVPLLDVYAAFPTDARDLDLLLRDGLNLNAKGARLWASAIGEVLRLP